MTNSRPTAVAIAWLPGPAGTRRRVAKPSVEELDAAEPARPDLWGARVSNDPGLPDRFRTVIRGLGGAVTVAGVAAAGCAERQRELQAASFTRHATVGRTEMRLTQIGKPPPLAVRRAEVRPL